MKALVKREAKVGLWLEDVPEPTVGPTDVLIKVKRTAICGTDLHIYKWDKWSQKTIKTPMVIGHEFVGEIVSVGSSVVDFEPGQIVSGEGHVVCGHCRNCMAGRRHLCNDTSGIGVNRAGAFAEYVALPAANVWEHRPGIDLDVAALFDPFGNAVHTALQWPLLGEDVLITGSGPIGAMAAAVCKHAGARHIVITDLNDSRLALAAKLGATRTVNVTQEKLEDVVKSLGMSEGFDVGLEMSGSPAAFNSMLDNMAHGGKISMLGIPAEDVAIDWNKVIFNMLTIKGIYGREMYETWYKMSVMVETGLDITPVITHRLHYTEFQKGFDAMIAGDAAKVILSWE
ncbi:L-threonine 3-dehydrogenase [Simiduia curdlanivorans]|uniref:L-threonine 3-dehydrogenase n=1 Tax=Simiduia curdlanivorans TaxID=1492769 RepID=A0ABV8UZ79_9GAMM|nr:L-threonine 3-dehydrogenase [Simiduia curdlanivorans]MDN3640499.1 L-threonine 3-dehydrogenase [Simiduia curdlanivorans]